MAHKRPNPDGLLDGQVALNYNAEDPGMFFRVTDGTLTKIGPVSVTHNGLAPNATPVGSTGNALGEEWLDWEQIGYIPERICSSCYKALVGKAKAKGICSACNTEEHTAWSYFNHQISTLIDNGTEFKVAIDEIVSGKNFSVTLAYRFD